jgi:thioredoxin reductase (NADPH)
MSSAKECDIIIVGGGPAGLTAAINAASEGLRVCVVDGAMSLGGQAKESRAIENYPLPITVPDGVVTGADLMAGFIEQARKFHADMFCPVMAAGLRVEDRRCIVMMDDYQEFTSKTVLLANGLSYRRLDVDNIGAFMGRGVYYGLPAVLPEDKKVAIIGGANSAGQAALKLAESNHVRMIIRKTLDAQMSDYLVQRIKASGKIDVYEHAELTRLEGNSHLERILFITEGFDKTFDTSNVYVFIGALPRTLWLGNQIELDEGKYVKTDMKVPFMTSLPGVFAAGDVRSGSTKRIAAAIGEAVGALQMIHRRIISME